MGEDEDEEDKDEKEKKSTTKKSNADEDDEEEGEEIKKIIKFTGEYSDIIGKNKQDKEKFLKACSDYFTDEDYDVKCSDVKCGSVILTLVSKSSSDMDKVVDTCVKKGLSFGKYKFEKGKDVTADEKEEEEKENEEKEEEDDDAEKDAPKEEEEDDQDEEEGLTP